MLTESQFPIPISRVDAVISALNQYRFRFGSEIELQNGIEKVLVRAEIPFTREIALSAKERPDFFVGESTALEIKTKGTVAALLRQVFRYAALDAVSEIIVVGTPAWIANLPSEINGKPLYRLRLINSLF
jgi:hypothetical protein